MDYAYKVTPGRKVRLADHDPDETHGVAHDKSDPELADLNAQLGVLQEMQYAAGQNGVLIVLQGPDTAGKDGTVKHVMAQFNPTSCRVESFKVPTPEEMEHDFLWRVHRVTPPKGVITIFNRSHYEDVLVARVHKLVPRPVWERRYTDINNFESLLADNDTIILKFYLHISKDEQRQRLLARAEDKDKAWKLSASDWPEHARYDAYVDAYEDALARCSTREAPWYVVPANHKWFRNLAVARTIVDALAPYKDRWRAEMEQRGQQNLAAIATAQGGAAPSGT